MRTYALQQNETLKGYDIIEFDGSVDESGNPTSITILTCYDIERVDGLIAMFKAEDLRILEEEEQDMLAEQLEPDEDAVG